MEFPQKDSMYLSVSYSVWTGITLDVQKPAFIARYALCTQCRTKTCEIKMDHYLLKTMNSILYGFSTEEKDIATTISFHETFSSPNNIA